MRFIFSIFAVLLLAGLFGLVALGFMDVEAPQSPVSKDITQAVLTDS